MGRSVCLAFFFDFSQPLYIRSTSHFLGVLLRTPGSVMCEVVCVCVCERLSKKLQAAMLEVKQSGCSEQAQFELALQ